MRFPLTHSIHSKFKCVGQSRFAGLIEKVAFKQRLEGDEGVSYVCIREKSILVTNLDPTQCPWSWPLERVSPHALALLQHCSVFPMYPVLCPDALFLNIFH